MFPECHGSTPKKMSSAHYVLWKFSFRFRTSLLAFWVVVVAIADASPVLGAQESRSCQNPLFDVHWAGKSDIRHLEANPTENDLALCPAWSGRPSCCSRSFEASLDKVFQRWVTHFQRRSQHIRDFMLDMSRVKVSQVYTKAGKEQQQLFSKALESFAPVMHSHFNCFDTLLEYMAGMLCFSCDPKWSSKVLMDADDLRVQHIWISDRSNEALWESCRALGIAAAELHTRIADSALVKTIGTRFEDLSMFLSKISVSEYMAVLGLVTMRGQNEHELRLEPGGVPSPQRQLSAYAGSTLDPVYDGRASGFRCSVFPREPLDLSSRAAMASWPALLAAVSSLASLCLHALRPSRRATL